MKNVLLWKTVYAGAAVNPYRIVKFGADDDHMIQSDAAGDLHVAVSGELGADNAGDQLDVATHGITPVEYGGTVTRGQKLTADASGRAVTAATGNQVIGTAWESGVLGDIGSVNIDRSTLP